MRTLRVLLFILIIDPAAGSANDSDADYCRDERELMQVLARGTIEAVWDVFETDAPDFIGIGDPEDEDVAECRASLLAMLTRAVSRTDDTRIPARILDEIEFDDLPALEPILRTALAHGDPDVRRHAARAAHLAEDPALASPIEDRFAIETDARVRRDLIRALASSESRKFLPELREIVESADPGSRDAAVDALIELDDKGSVEIFEELAMNDSDLDPERLSRVVEALASWSDSSAAHAALRRIGRNGPSEAASLVIRELSGGENGDLDALIDIAAARATDDDPELREQAAQGIELMTSPNDVETITLSCGGAQGGVKWRDLPLASREWDDFHVGTDYVVAPANGWSSARCWDAPGFMWPGEIRARVPSGASVVTIDEFAWQGERWLAVIDPQHICWMPDSDLSNEEPAPLEGDAVLEVDVSQDDADSWAARTLAARGWSTTLETEGGVVLLSLDAIPDRETVTEMVRIRRLADSPAMALVIGRWLYANGQWLNDDEELGSGIPDGDPRWAEEDDEAPTEP